jgi:hypothetical protein
MATANAMSDYLELALLDHMTGFAAYTRPASVWAALYSAAPSDSGGGTQLTGAGGYARKQITFGAASAGIVANSANVTFGPASGADWAAATHFGIFDAETSGNLLFWGALDTARTVAVGQSAQFNATTDKLTVDMSATDQLTTACANAILNFVLRNTAWTPGCYLALYTSAPGEGSGGTEVVTTGNTLYARMAAAFGQAASGAATQAGTITFPTAGAAWGTILWHALCASDVEGTDDPLFYWDVTDRLVNNGDIYSVAAGTMVLTLN